jgi:hypothetical protein
VARTANLHGLGGIPAERIDIKVIVHGQALYSLVTDDRYLKEMEDRQES